MSLNFIHDFQMTIYNLLSGAEEIRLNVDRIYLSVVQDAKYPFLLINILKAEDISKFSYAIYNIEFEICIFARDKNQGTLISLADKITNKLSSENNQLKDYIIAGTKLQEIVFHRSQDLVTNKLVILYKTLLKKGLNL
jgi:hypothetical protein